MPIDKRLNGSMVEVTLRRFPELVHGFANMRQLGGRFEESLEEIAGNVRAKLGQRV